MAASAEVIAIVPRLSHMLFCSHQWEVMALSSLLLFWILKVSFLRNQISQLWTQWIQGEFSIQWSISLELYLHDFPYLMTFHQQDKHTCKVEPSFLSPWIRNPGKQVQEAGGNSGEQNAAMPCFSCSMAPQGCGRKKRGALQLTRGSSL